MTGSSIFTVGRHTKIFDPPFLITQMKEHQKLSMNPNFQPSLTDLWMDLSKNIEAAPIKSVKQQSFFSNISISLILTLKID
jgi:hypothetical protein